MTHSERREDGIKGGIQARRQRESIRAPRPRTVIKPLLNSQPPSISYVKTLPEAQGIASAVNAMLPVPLW